MVTSSSCLAFQDATTRLTFNRKVFHDGKEFETLDIDEPTVGGIEAFERAKAKGDTGRPPSRS